MSLLSSLSERQRYWYQHLQQACEQQLSLLEYAQRQGLSASALYSAKGVLKAKGVLADEGVRPARFSAVTVIGNTPGGCTVRMPGLSLELSSPPSPSWLAALSQALGRDA
ncbi:MAG: hypothetical protein HY940_02245 [Gammaproteobacteria bacterium]|nr:hypothetical protein [Gammaproteobacteria bacterium]